MEAAVIGLDLGTTTCKSIVFDENLKILGEAYIEYPLINVSALGIEQDANLWWELTKRVIKKSVNSAKIMPGAIKAIGVSSQGLAFVPVDKNCRPLRNAFSWLDMRAKKQKENILTELNQKNIFSITGTRGSEGFVLPKLQWFRENELETYKNTYKVLMGHDFIIANLCGSIITDHTMAGGTLMYDIKKRQWSDKIIGRMGFDAAILPGIVNSGSVAGTIKSNVAEELGLSRNTLVCTGGQDQKCAAFGAGIEDGIATVSLGTAAAITQICKYPVIDEQMNIPCSSFVLEDKWVNEGVVGTACASLQWIKNNLFSGESYLDLDKMVESDYGKVNRVFFYPYLTGASTPYWNKNVRGHISGISLSTSAAEIVTSVLEGVAFQVKTNLDIMQKLYKPLKEIRIFGGGSKSEIWCRIISNVTNMKVVTLYTPETANIGAAILAGQGCRMFNNREEILKKIIVKKEIFPEKQLSDMYMEKYSEYLRFNEKMLS